jgi:hypothetical protein
MSRIRTKEELRNEIRRLQQLSLEKKTRVKKDIDAVKESLSPSGILREIISGITGIRMKKENFIRDGFAYTLSLIVQQFFLKSEKKFEQGIYGVIDKLIDKLRTAVNSFSSHEAKRRERGNGEDS